MKDLSSEYHFANVAQPMQTSSKHDLQMSFAIHFFLSSWEIEK